MRVVVLILVINALWIQNLDGKKVLLVPGQNPSHMFQMLASVEGLAERGHELYVMVKFHLQTLGVFKDLPVTLIHFDNEDTIVEFPDMNALVFEATDFVFGSFIAKFANDQCNYAINNETFMGQLRALKFDLAVVDGFAGFYCPFIIPKALGVPYVFHGSIAHLWDCGLPALPSFVPLVTALPTEPHTDHMTFAERLRNLFQFWKAHYTEYDGQHNMSLLAEFAPDVSSWNDLVRQSVLFIITRDHLLEWPIPSLPNVIFTPGCTMKHAKRLPEKLEKIINQTDEFILVSFGTMAGFFPQQMIDKLEEAINRINVTVIWAMPIGKAQINTEKHVHLFEWVPQNDVLGHPKIKAFVTHCGSNGQYEAVYHGVPMVGLPILGDQPRNCFRHAKHGYGVCIEAGMKSFTADDLLSGVRAVLDSPHYGETIRKASAIMRDQPMSPGETATFWLDHVLKFGGGHLRSHAQDMPLYQMFMIDVLLVILIMVFVICAIGMFVLRKCWNVACGRFNKVKQS